MYDSPTTNCVLAKRALGKHLGSEVAEWAISRLVIGSDTPHLRQLAGATGDEYPTELEALFDQTIRELGLQGFNRRSVILGYAQEIARNYLTGRWVSRTELLWTLSHLYWDSNLIELYNFERLSCANDDLKSQTFTYEYDVSRETFEDVLRKLIDVLLKLDVNNSEAIP